ncbi:2-dehydropantoate 2-reductase [Penicillium macrosclerotiorum]|uniref:2-dehydropantoate 2-reductase n=1 Tax=Penicillium macrosclerotiorum TaxID=303699 RepID=UPI0025465EDD|nr:2-dehydropantoate 2-reductase [Penicillium macrosclerotiorum]KAJ5676041.1 2-dehydropantoate 2-reductase [Penicillium macrosclerotiorum]
MPSQTTPQYQVCLIGSGGVGTIASVVLSKSGLAHVTCVLRSKYDYVSQHGWDIDSVDHGKISGWKPHRIVRSAAEAATDENGEQVEYDFVVVCTKQLPSRNPVVGMISPMVTPGKTTIVMIQNGMGIEEEIINAWPGNAVVSSVSHIGSSVQEPNVVVQIGEDVSKMGPHLHTGIDDSTSVDNAKQFIDMYLQGGASVCELVEDIQVARWEKLLWNGSFNTMCALMRMDVGELQRSKGRESMIVPMMWEIWNIAKAAGHPMPESIVEWMAYRLPDDCNYRPSMLLDLENGRPMELEVILGYPLKKAQELGVDAPHMTTIHKLLKLEEWKLDQSKLSGNT